jgi:hypothetical protein
MENVTGVLRNKNSAGMSLWQRILTGALLLSLFFVFSIPDLHGFLDIFMTTYSITFIILKAQDNVSWRGFYL